MILTGKTISPGMARGVAHVIDARAILAGALKVDPRGAPQQEIERLHAAIGYACVQLDRLQRQLTGRVRPSDVAIFSSHASLLRDSKFIARIESEIQERGKSAESAVSQVVKGLYADFIGNQVTLLQDKAADILDIGRRLLDCLSDGPRTEVKFGAETVVVAAALTPSELVRFAHQKVVAVIAETCGAKSHTAILARGLAIPMLTNVRAACETIPDNTEVVVDASGGMVIFAPQDETENQAIALIEQHLRDAAADDGCPDVPVSADGVSIKLLLNISDPVESPAIQHLGAAGVGLFRTEFLYMDRSWWPTEDENYAIYQQVASNLGESELNIRLVDFGAEKCPPYADFPMSRNPSLGLRGIRLLLQRADVLQPQVAALAKLGRERPLTVLLPMLDTLDTLDLATEAICEYARCSDRGHLPFRLGTMIEVPAAAYMIEEILERVDSVSIGLNDLTQYVLAADRDDEFLEAYHDPMQPCVLRLVHRIVQAAGEASKPVTICGELAGDPSLIGLLMALGVRRLSVSRSNYLDAVSIVRHLSLRAMSGMADEVLKMTSGVQVHRYVSEYLSRP